MSRVERFTQDMRQILALAQGEAEKAKNATIDTPHILLGMLRLEDSLACRVLKDLKVDYERALPVVRSIYPAELHPPAKLNLSPETKRLLESAVDEARKLGHHYVGSEHLLLAFVRGDDKSVRYLMRQIKLEPEVARSCVKRLLQGDFETLPTTAPFTEDALPLEEEPVLPPAPPSAATDPRTRVIEMVEADRITIDEAAELLKAMPFTVPISTASAYVILPLDSADAASLQDRSLRITISDRTTPGAKIDVTLPFEQAQTELLRLLRAIYHGSSGTLLDLDNGTQRIAVSLD